MEDEAYAIAVALFIERCNRESIFGCNGEDVVSADTVKMALGELFDIWPESTRPDDEPANVHGLP